MASQQRSPEVSRRNFMRMVGAGAAAAAALPALAPEALAQQRLATSGSSDTPRPRSGGDLEGNRHLPPDAVIISANENPLGPAHSALAAIVQAGPTGGRYDKFGVAADTVKVFSEQNGLKPGYVELYPGSGGPLDMALMSNISPERGLVCADPSYEQGPRAAQAVKAPCKMVPLTSTYAHDVKAMLAADPNAGAFYVVNPNNPTGTTTPRADILWLLKNKPAGSVVIVDEAYIHFSNAESVLDQVAADQDLIVLRTFSKIYGMAGVRAGFAVARPDLLAKFQTISPDIRLRTVASVSLYAAVAANASLRDASLVPARRRINTDIRTQTIEFLDKRGYTVVPGSQANMFMVDVKRPGRDFMSAMLKENVAIGRTWPVMPTYVRVTVGTQPEMEKFQTAFVKCMDMPSTTVNASLHSELYVPSELHRIYA